MELRKFTPSGLKETIRPPVQALRSFLARTFESESGALRRTLFTGGSEILTLKVVNSPSLVGPLSELLLHPHRETRVWAAEILVRVASTEGIFIHPALENMRRALRPGQDFGVQCDILTAMNHAGIPQGLLQ